MNKLLLAALLCGAVIRPASAEVVDLQETRMAASFVDGIDVNAHLVWLDTVYADTDKVESSLRYLGIRNVRDMSPPVWWMAPYERLAANGIRFNFR